MTNGNPSVASWNSLRSLPAYIRQGESFLEITLLPYDFSGLLDERGSKDDV
jgi:hypothetical protein